VQTAAREPAGISLRVYLNKYQSARIHGVKHFSHLTFTPIVNFHPVLNVRLLGRLHNTSSTISNSTRWLKHAYLQARAARSCGLTACSRQWDESLQVNGAAAKLPDENAGLGSCGPSSPETRRCDDNKLQWCKYTGWATLQECSKVQECVVSKDIPMGGECRARPPPIVDRPIVDRPTNDLPLASIPSRPQVSLSTSP
jgi:hypothetical protein